MWFFFFFQAEDGIRDYKVTGVQTCALPSAAPSEAHVFADGRSVNVDLEDGWLVERDPQARLGLLVQDLASPAFDREVVELAKLLGSMEQGADVGHVLG